MSAVFDTQTHFAWTRTRLAGERTLMSWERVSLSLTSLGFGLYQTFKNQHEARIGHAVIHPEASRDLALVLAACGMLGTLFALWEYLAGARYLASEEFAGVAERAGMPHWLLPVFLGVFLALIGIVTTVWIAIGG